MDLADQLREQAGQAETIGLLTDDTVKTTKTAAIGEAAADIDAARQEILANVDRIYDIVDAGHEVSFGVEAQGALRAVILSA